MVKGIVKHAVIVRGTGVDHFDEAIFLSDGTQPEISSATELLTAARRIAGEKRTAPRDVKGYVIAFLSGVIFSAILAAIYLGFIL